MSEHIDLSVVIRQLAIGMRHWLRAQRRLQLLQFRKNWATMRSEYELVGGPLDGQVIKWRAQTTYFVGDNLGGGAYRHEGDCRMHYHVDATAGSGA